MKDFIIMEQKEFEKAIENFTIQIVDETTGMVEYQVTRKPKVTIIDRRKYAAQHIILPNNVSLRSPKEQVRPFVKDPNHKPHKGRRARGCFTPDGVFESIVAAAEYYNIDKGLMCCRVTARVKKGIPGWGFIKHD